MIAKESSDGGSSNGDSAARTPIGSRTPGEGSEETNDQLLNQLSEMRKGLERYIFLPIRVLCLKEQCFLENLNDMTEIVKTIFTRAQKLIETKGMQKIVGYRLFFQRVNSIDVNLSKNSSNLSI